VSTFYRQAGDPSKPTILLLHGFPTSSHMFRDLITEFADEYHLIAPDYPGYGSSAMPNVEDFDYSFDNVARLIGKVVDEIGVNKFSMYLMDYGAPVGFRIATVRPNRIQSLIVQNVNAYDEGIDNNFWEPVKAYWKARKSYCKKWCSGFESSSGLVDVCYLDSVFEFHPSDHLGQVIEAT
jgi:pimeloyl-ACP methyl ester carboxylesterase